MTRTTVLVVALAGLAAVAGAADDATKTIVVPPGTERSYDEWHYAPAVRVGDMVIVSGVPAMGKPDATYETKVRNMFNHVREVLAESGADMADVVELTTFHRDAKDTETFRQEFAVFSKVHAEFFPKDYPAWTAVGTTALLAPGAPVEMRVVAMVGSGKRVKVKRPAPAASPAPK